MIKMINFHTVRSRLLLAGILGLFGLGLNWSRLCGAELLAGKVVGLAGNTVLLPITLSGNSNIVAAQFEVLHDTNGLRSEAVIANLNQSEFSVDSNEITPGSRRIIVYSLRNKSLPSGTLLNLPLATSRASTSFVASVLLTNAIFADAQAQALTGVVLTPGAIAINAAAVSQFTSINYDAHGVLQLQFTGTPDRSYIFQASTNLQSWSSFSTNLPNGGLINLSVSNIPGPQGFYRAIQAP